jgi:hypothetical protein
VLDPLEYDVKAYFTLGGAVHDAAVSAWGIKGWYNTRLRSLYSKFLYMFLQIHLNLTLLRKLTGQN